MATTVQKTIRVTQEQWDRVDYAAKARNVTPNHLLVELAMEALKRRDCPRSEAEIHHLRSAMIAAQAIARDMIAEGREDQVEEIRRDISRISPHLPQLT